jgi:hypothetical protein
LLVLGQRCGRTLPGAVAAFVGRIARRMDEPRTLALLTIV